MPAPKGATTPQLGARLIRDQKNVFNFGNKTPIMERTSRHAWLDTTHIGKSPSLIEDGRNKMPILQGIVHMAAVMSRQGSHDKIRETEPETSEWKNPQCRHGSKRLAL